MAKFKGYSNLTETLVMKANILEQSLETNGLNVTSGFRTVERNKQVGGWDKSYHLKGMALDIGRSSFKENPQEFYTKAKMAGFGGVGIYDTHVHVDTGPNNFWDNRTKNGKYDNNFVKVNTSKVNLGKTDVNHIVDSVLGNTELASLESNQMKTPLIIGILILAIVKVLKD